MTIITISREFGSGGDRLASQVAKTLGFHLVDKVFISDVLCEYGLTEFDMQYDNKVGFWEGFDVDKTERRETMVTMLNRVIRMVARHGNSVILGRSGYAILGGFADVMHVRVHAPFEARVATVCREQALPESEARALVKNKDKIRTAFVESFYRVPWDSPQAFDVSLNTAVVSVDMATAWVVEAAKRLKSCSPEGPTTSQLEFDPVLMQAVTEKLGCPLDHS